QYHPDRANIVADALSQKSSGSLMISTEKRQLVKELHELYDQGLQLAFLDSGALLAQFRVCSILTNKIKASQCQDPLLMDIMTKTQQGHTGNFTIDDDGALRMGTRLCVPDVDELKREIMEEAHSTAYSVHPGSTKMYKDLRNVYWWNGMKRDIA